MISFGLTYIKAYGNGLGSGCIIATGGAGTATVASGYCFIGGVNTVVSAGELDFSAISNVSGTKYIFARYAANQSSTATLDATSVDPRGSSEIAFLGTIPNDSGDAGVPDISGISAIQPIGRANNCSLNITYDQAIARGGTLIFGNDMKMYNGAIEGTLEHADFNPDALRHIYNGTYASAGVGSGTWTLSATQAPVNFMLETKQVTNGVTAVVQILKCYSPGLTFNMDRENYTMPTLNFQAIGNQEGTVLKILTS